MAIKFKTTLDFQQEYYTFEVCSLLDDYQIALMINRELNFDLRRRNNLELITNDNVCETFSLFEWKRENNVSYFLVYPNAHQSPLMPVFYFFIQGVENENIVDNFINGLQSLPEIISVDNINIGDLMDLPKRFQTSAYKKRIVKIHDILYGLEETMLL